MSYKFYFNLKKCIKPNNFFRNIWKCGKHFVYLQYQLTIKQTKLWKQQNNNY